MERRPRTGNGAYGQGANGYGHTNGTTPNSTREPYAYDERQSALRFNDKLDRASANAVKRAESPVNRAAAFHGTLT